MGARWSAFAVGMGLLLAPLATGYARAGGILRDVSAATLVCVTALASLEWPRIRALHVLTAIWLLRSAQRSGDPGAARVELAAGALLLVVALVPRRRRAPALPAPQRA